MKGKDGGMEKACNICKYRINEVQSGNIKKGSGKGEAVFVFGVKGNCRMRKALIQKLDMEKEKKIEQLIRCLFSS